ncbi:putative late blight resistance protein -like protein R1C-3-like [Capsicum annuum]|nr:putative late blight resistance protein -like protein R1C-3-like [Capsicum annuum]
MSCISYEVHGLVQSVFHQSRDDMLVKLKDRVVPYLLKNIKSFIASDYQSESSATMTEGQLVELLDALLVNLHYLPKVRAKLILPSMTQYELLQNVFGNLKDFHGLKVNGSIELHLLLKIIPVSLEVMYIFSTNLKASKSVEVGCFIKKLLEVSPDILREYLTHLQQHMINAITHSISARKIHVMIEFLLIILTDVPKDVIHHGKLFVLLERVGAVTKEASVLVFHLEENIKETRCASLNLLENIELLRKDIKNVFLKAPTDSSQLKFSMSDGPLFMILQLKNLNDLLKSNAYSVYLIKQGERIPRTHKIILQECEKIKLVKKEVQEKISKKTSIIFPNSPNNPSINKSSIAGKIIVGFEEEIEWIIRKPTSGPTKIDVISIVGIPGIGKTTLANRVYNDMFVVGYFDVRAWYIVNQKQNEKKLLHKIFNQVIGVKERFNEDNIGDNVAYNLWKQLLEKRFDLTSDELSRIGRSLRNLQKLELVGARIHGGKGWNMEQVTFKNLKLLRLYSDTPYNSTTPQAIWSPPLTQQSSPQPKFAARVGVSNSDTPQGTRPSYGFTKNQQQETKNQQQETKNPRVDP